MRFSNLLLPFALLLIASAYTEEDIIGTWTAPVVRSKTNSYCCVPTSITIEDGAFRRLVANFNYAFGYEGECYKLFQSATGGSISISNTDLPGSYSGTPYQQTDIVFHFEALYTFISGLKIYIKSSKYSDPCDFSMTKKNAINFTPILVVIGFVLIGAFIAFKLYQKKQQNLIQKQSVAQPNYNYTAPNVGEYQAFPQSQPQGGFNQQTI